MKKIIAFILVLSTFFLCGCTVDDNIFGYLNDKMQKDLDEQGLLYKFPPVETSVEAVLDESVEQYYEVTDIIINGENYTDVYFENTGIEFTARELAVPRKAVANYSDIHTFYEFETDSGVTVLADNINLKIFIRPEDEEKFIDFYHDYNNYDYFCYDSNKNGKNVKLEADYMARLFTELTLLHTTTDNMDYQVLDYYNTIVIDEDCENYTIRAVSKDWLVEFHEVVMIFYFNGKYYCAESYCDESYYCNVLSDEYQQYFKKTFETK